ncbi:MAG: DUF3990 domain-containing protein [Lachnospiraceae bacterium]|nr:DUF3990 domain-containing protein [Lachnospiraceae bacterium]
MIIYHGSDHIIQQPVFGEGKTYNDYGRGFYCTFSSDMAKEWGAAKSKDGFVNQYTIDTDGLSILDLNSPEFCILHWLSVLLENRRFDISAPLASQAREYILSAFHVEYDKSDCITGYRADDSYFSFAQDFLNGTISYRQLKHSMRLGELGVQFVLKSEKAFSRIKFVDFEIAGHEEWYSKRMQRDKSARREYFDKERSRVLPGDIFITQILSEEIKPDDPRLR